MDNQVEEEAQKKRAALRQMRAEEDPDEDVEEDAGTWKKADENTISQRRIFKPRRNKKQESTEISAPLPGFNFASAASKTEEGKEEKKVVENQKPTAAVEKKIEEKKEEKKVEEKKEETQVEEKKDENKEEQKSDLFKFDVNSSSSNLIKPNTSGQSSVFGASFLSFPTSSSTSSSLFGNVSSFSFGTMPAFSQDSSKAFPFESSKIGIFGNKDEDDDNNNNNNENNDDEDNGHAEEENNNNNNDSSKHLPTVATVTGEETETTKFQRPAKLFILEKDGKKTQWKERGKGTLKLNEENEENSSAGETKESKKPKGRLLMRVERTFGLILNAPLYLKTASNIRTQQQKTLTLQAPQVATSAKNNSESNQEENNNNNNNNNNQQENKEQQQNKDQPQIATYLIRFEKQEHLEELIQLLPTYTGSEVQRVATKPVFNSTENQKQEKTEQT